MKQTNFAVELPNGYVLGYFNTYKEAINYVSKSDYLGIYDLQIRSIDEKIKTKLLNYDRNTLMDINTGILYDKKTMEIVGTHY